MTKKKRKSVSPTGRWHPLSIYDPVYGVRFIVLWDVDGGTEEARRIARYCEKELEITFSPYDDVDNDFDIDINMARSIGCRRAQAVIMLFRKKKPKDGRLLIKPGVNTLVHEITHAVNFVFSWKDIKIDANHDEPHAYYMGWLAAAIAEHGHKHKLWNK